VLLAAGPLYIDEFLDAAACRRIRQAMDRGAIAPAEILDGTIAVDDQVRRAASIEVDPAIIAAVEQRLERAREEVGRFFGRALIAREGTNFLRYGEGDFYLPHVDRAVVDSWPDAARRQVALVIFLNSSTPTPGPDQFSGGALCLIDAGVDVTPRAGLLVAFDAGMLHEVTPVRQGTRDVIVDWFY
jgi:predicted 2-oxoglutarate/Fe(II)-dependent dioxygenase YbiX